MFHHDIKIPADFALAIYNIMHNLASHKEWDLIDSYRAKKKDVFGWIESILKDNNQPNLKVEMDWWKEQITFPEN
jgi:hypothetical protein